MTLRAVQGGWINTDFEKEYPIDTRMITQERKSKYKHKVMFTGTDKRENEMIDWCEQSFGPGGRKWRWRFGWLGHNSTFYFKNSKDAMMFTLRWSS